MQLAYLFHQCAKGLLSRDSQIADCTVRHPGVERPFSSLIMYYMLNRGFKSCFTLRQLSHQRKKYSDLESPKVYVIFYINCLRVIRMLVTLYPRLHGMAE